MFEDRDRRQLAALTGASVSTSPLWMQIARDVMNKANIVRQYRVLEVYPNGRLRAEPSDRDPDGPAMDIDLYRFVAAVVSPGDLVLAIQFASGPPVVLGTVATSDSDTATVRVRWDQVIDPPARYAPDVIAYTFEENAASSATNTATFVAVGAPPTVTLPPGRWGCIMTATAQMARSVASGGIILRAQVGGITKEQNVANATGLPLTNVTPMEVTIVRNDAASPMVVNVPTVLTLGIAYRGDVTAGTTYVRGAKLSGYFFRL